MQKFDDWSRERSGDAESVPGVLPAVLRAVVDSFTAPETASDRSGSRSRTGLGSAAGILSFLLIVLLVLIDRLVAPRMSFLLFYVLIVTFAAWSGGRRKGMVIAGASSLALLLHELRVSAGKPADGFTFLNLGMEALIFFFAAWVVSAMRGLAETLERRVKDRTVALERQIGERRQTEEQLLKTMQQFRQLAENISDAFWMREAGDLRMVYVSPAYEKIWGRSCKALYQSADAWLDAVHPEDRELVAQAMRTKQSVGEYNQDYRILRADGSMRWIRDRAFPIRDGSGKVIRIVGIAEDITERRRLEREILEISDREQARIGQDLHDGLCQKLVSVAFDHDSLERKLAARTLAEAEDARQIAELLDDVITEARALARGFFPVELEGDGLTIALEQLAVNANARGTVNCRVESEPVLIHQNAVGTHLYRIAQEAVNNAIKHARARTILVELRGGDDRVELRITDDGVGMPAAPRVGGGMGLHIMDYRARTIGGTLDITRAANGGTVVHCSAPQQAG